MSYLNHFVENIALSINDDRDCVFKVDTITSSFGSQVSAKIINLSLDGNIDQSKVDTLANTLSKHFDTDISLKVDEIGKCVTQLGICLFLNKITPEAFGVYLNLNPVKEEFNIVFTQVKLLGIDDETK